MKFVIIRCLNFYRKYLSINKLRCCRFYPSCSEYAIDAVYKYGVFKAVVKIAYRVLRCNPFSRGGYDPA